MTNYSGSLSMSGTLTDSLGDSATLSGTLGVTLRATFSSASGGVASDTLYGWIDVQYQDATGATSSNSIPLNLSLPNTAFQSGNFTISENDTAVLQGLNVGVTLQGTVSADTTQFTENLSLLISGTYQGITFDGTITSSGTLVAAAPLIIGTMANRPVAVGSSLSPFGNVAVIDPKGGQTETLTVTLSAAANGTLTNLAGGTYNATTGNYTVTGSAAAVTSALDGLVFTPAAKASSPNTTTGFTINVFDTAFTFASDTTTSVIVAPTGFSIQDTTTGTPSAGAETPYAGLVTGLSWQYITVTPDSINLTVTAPNAFLHTGSGNDAIDVSRSNGNNVLDGGTGSNFLVGGTGNDTFFVDDRGPASDTWSTVVNFHAGDAATIWGVTPSDFALSWVAGQGAAGYTGLTLHATASGLPTASLTLAGFASADLTNGRLIVTYGTTPMTGGVPGSSYMLIQGH